MEGRQGRRRRIPGVLAVLACLWPPVASSPEPVPYDIRERIQADLLVILAHPDDEGVVAPLLAREAAERRRRVAVVYLTDGRNGTNRAGDLHGRPFGIVRLAEVHWTLDRLGVSIFHCLDLPDGEGSGDPAQVLRSWGRESTTGRLVRLIRLLRPREILTWFPGPAASHADHMAAGGAAVLAAKAASEAGAFRDQIEVEKLEPWADGAVWLVAQTEKLGYDPYPEADEGRAARTGVRSIRLDEYSDLLRRKYTDLAREAMKEQRAVRAANNLDRDGPFDDPIRLWPVSGEAARGPVRLEIEGSAPQEFLEEIASEAGMEAITGYFQPEARIARGEGLSLRLSLARGEAAALEGRAALELPRGWKARPSSHAIALGKGDSVLLEWSLRPPRDTDPGHFPAFLVVPGSRLPFVITLPEESRSRR